MWSLFVMSLWSQIFMTEYSATIKVNDCSSPDKYILSQKQSWEKFTGKIPFCILTDAYKTLFNW